MLASGHTGLGSKVPPVCLINAISETFHTDQHDLCSTVLQLKNSSEDVTPVPREPSARKLRRNPVGFLSQLVSLEATRLLHTPPKTRAPPSKPIVALSDIHFNLNTQFVVDCLFRSAGKQHIRREDTGEELQEGADDSSTTVAPDDSFQHTFSSFLERVSKIQQDRAEKLEEKKKKEAEAQRLKAERKATAAKLEEAKKQQQEAADATAERKKLARLEEAEALPQDVRAGLMYSRALEVLEQDEVFREYLSSQNPQLKQLRIIIMKKTSSVPNQLAGNVQKLQLVYNSVSEIKGQLMTQAAEAACAGLATKFARVLERVAKIDADLLKPLMALNLPLFAFYLRLSSTILQTARCQVALEAVTVWGYAHFIHQLLVSWSKPFQLIFLGCLVRESSWTLPHPASDAGKRKTMSLEETAEWCRDASALFRLRVAILYCMKDARETWSFTARFLNRVCKRFSHPLTAFCMEVLFDVLPSQLKECSQEGFWKMLTLCADDIFPEVAKHCTEPEWKVPLTKLETRVRQLLEHGPMAVIERPKGYFLKAQAASLKDL
eukprot:Blabericola_migrator_1__10092@NODE_55_length_16001_cov_154_094327_g51_i0_p3_GENE_NODE_55_length_16001_cov_154_094327_g51_i0NODE_55_length_16001_cov_154_094327_g51_i0_p3_ORF_typecomplete_len550_score86_70GLE1/PF07817_13/3_6e12SMC_N/PF02463_19/0_0096DUF874/PF05917_11/0_022DUF3498/PF12004_8/0_042DUF737/PF05300_11/0_19Borrelia_P83/PF05262_11/0_27AIFMLS/PF14962_6/0_56Miga/PF10265_9/0_87Selenoprotein_S/PF06936_11/2_2RNA_pol_Rpc82/PF05645_13/11RNA_pol_Rpc82/PF05645_13/6_1e02APG6_N/PF17675_1/4_5APG6_N/P